MHQSTFLVAFLGTLLPRVVLSAPVRVSLEATEPGQFGYRSSYDTVTARDELTTAGRSRYNSVETFARDATTALETDGRSGYNSVEVVEREVSTDAETDGRSGYN